ncbi:MAG: Ldh family oxidoreductase [Candidatus Poribacteria bacterium]|nr:Ldh family oxidoreductase [Candidatus Poribacteria bacterium]
MNRPPEEFIRVDEERLLNFSTACFEKAGITHDHAALISRLLVNSDLRGVRSHGTRTLSGYCGGFENGSLNPNPDIRVIHETPTTVVLNGDGTLGYLPMVRATEHAIAKAKEVGIGMGLVRYIGHYGSAGHYARLCNEEGCIGFSVQGYQNHGNAAGQDPKPQLGYYGNPPICFAIPSGDEPPVVLDAATCIMADYQRGPEFDELLSIIPAAFFKSIGYTAVACLLGGALTGFTEAPPEDTAKWSGAKRHGGMVLAIHIESVVPPDVFHAEVDRLVRDIRETYEPMPGTDQALLPGAIEVERTEIHRRDGIRYGEMEQASARAASERLSVPLPWNE